MAHLKENRSFSRSQIFALQPLTFHLPNYQYLHESVVPGLLCVLLLVLISTNFILKPFSRILSIFCRLAVSAIQVLVQNTWGSHKRTLWLILRYISAEYYKSSSENISVAF